MKEYKLDDGSIGSRADYIRQEFMKDKQRNEIAEELDIPYNTVYTATANMENAHHKRNQSTAGKGAMAKDPKTGELRKRNEIMKELYQEGWTRNEISVHFETPYGTVYAATKDVEPPKGSKASFGAKIPIEHPETGEMVARRDVIREMYEKGYKRRDISKELECDYTVVWHATKDYEERPDVEGDVLIEGNGGK